MAIALVFAPAAMNAVLYNEVIARLEKAGAGKPAGRLYHACYGSKDHLQVFDIWDSMESFEQFGKTLMPILGALGMDPGTPQVSEVHHIMIG